MNIWENAVITIQGLSLLSKLTGGNTLEITRAETGEGYVTPGLLNQLTGVSIPKQQLSFRATSYPEEGKCKLPCYLTNAGLAKGYTAKQIGVYAKDPDNGEILFLIVQAPSDQGTVIPSEAEMPGYSAEWNLYFQYGQASAVTVVVDPSNSVTMADLEKIGGIVDVLNPVEDIEDLLVYDKEGNATTDIAKVHSGVFRIRRVWEKTSTDDNELEEFIIFTQRKYTTSGLYSLQTVHQEMWRDGVVSYRSVSFPIEQYPEFDSQSVAGLEFRKAEKDLSNVDDEVFAAKVIANVTYADIPDAPPKYSYGTEDLEAGVTALETGKMYLVYE